MKIIGILFLFLNISVYSQNVKRRILKIDTVENFGGISKEEWIMRGRASPFSMLHNFPAEQIPEHDIYGIFTNSNYFNLNYKIDKDGNIFFVKGSKGFPKIQIPEEFAGLDNFYYDDEIFLARLNHHISNYKAQHFENGILQPDCQKLSTVIFYCQIIIGVQKNKDNTFSNMAK